MAAGGLSIVTSGLVLALDAADKLSYPGSGTSWFDLSGNNTTGTLTNGPTFSAGNMGSIVFDGVNDYVDIANSSGLNFTNTSGTVSVWFKTTSINQYLIAKQLDTTGGWGMNINTVGGVTGTAYFETKNNASGATSCYRTVNVTVNNNLWTNVVATFTTSTSVVANNTILMYLNGKSSQGTLNQLLTYGGNTTSNVTIARRVLGDYYTGNIANTLIYNRELTATEILQNYNATKSRFDL